MGFLKLQKKITQIVIEPEQNKTIEKEFNSEDLLVSESEIDQAIAMHQKGIRKNWKMIAVVAFVSLALLSVLIFRTDFLTIDLKLAIPACLALNLISVKPFGESRKRARNIDLMELLKIKRERLTRVINNLDSEEIEKFNTEFYNCITI